MIADFIIYTESCCTMGKRKDWRSSNQIMTSSFSFVILGKVRAAQLHRKRMLIKEREREKISLISLMSSKIQATSREQILSLFRKSTSSENYFPQ